MEKMFQGRLCFVLLQSYCVAVYLVRKLSSDTLLSRLKHKGQRHADHTRALSKYAANFLKII